MEQVKKQQEELRRKQEEAKKKQAEELAQKRKEQQACAAIRQKLVKLKASTPDTFEANKKETDEILAKELENCGAQMAAMKTEAEKASEMATTRIEQINERKRKAEEMLAEQERKRKEALEKAQERAGELEKLVEAAEAAATSLKEEVDPLAEKDFTEKQLNAKVVDIETASTAATEAQKEVAEFLTQKAAELNPPKLDAELRTTIQKLRQRGEEVKKSNILANKKAKEGKDAQERKIGAKAITKKIDTLFAKYDKDKDGMLNGKEILAYAKGEFKFTVPNPDVIIKNLGGAKGVKKDLFQKLKVQVGIARESAKDAVRKDERLKKEAKVADLKEKLQAKIDEADKTVTETEELVVAAEKKAAPLGPKTKTMTSTEIAAVADEIDEAVTAAKEKVASTKESVAAVSEDVDPDVAGWLKSKVGKLEGKLGRADPRLTKAGGVADRLRSESKKKAVEEVAVHEKTALAMIKYHQKAKSLSSEDLLSAISSDDPITEDAFVAFFEKCEKEPAEEGKEETPTPAPEDLKRVFAHLDEDGNGSISKEFFTNFIRVFMKVTKEAAITSTISITDSKSIRRLDVGEVVEILEGPTKEDSVDVMRVRAKAMLDGVEGWITTEGNKGTSFLSEGGNLFKVKKDTILTMDFELEGETTKESVRMLKDTTRKLKVGEVVEVREWPRKEEKSGLMRMKCKCKTDGLVGWVTTVGNTGTVFLEVM